jgi:membrane-associated phospholipid phosphatase
MPVIETLTNFGDLAVLLPLAGLITLWLLAIRQKSGFLWWLLALAFCVGGTAELKIYFYVCPPFSDIHSPSGHSSLSVLVYGTLTLAVAVEVTGWGRKIAAIAGALFILSIAVSRLLVQAHSVPEIVIGLLIGTSALWLFATKYLSRPPVEPHVRPLIAMAVTFMMLLNGHELRAESFLRKIGTYLSHAGLMACM